MSHAVQRGACAPTSALRWLLIAAAAAVTARGQVDLALTLRTGQKVPYRREVTVTQHMSMGGSEMKSVNEISQDLLLEIREVDASGTATVALTVLRVRGKISTPQLGDVEFDSGKPAPKEPPHPALRDVLSQIGKSAGRQIIAKVGKNGAVTEARVANGAPRDRPERLLIELLGDHRPAQAVDVGETWPAAFAGISGASRLPFRFKGTHQLRALEDGVATLETRGSLTLDGKAAGKNPMLAAAKLRKGDVKRDATSTIADGLLTSVEATMTLDLENALGIIRNQTRVEIKREAEKK